MGILDDILGAKASSNRGSRIKDGEYLFEVQKVELGKKFAGSMAIWELKVLESKSISSEIAPNPVNDVVGFVNNIDKSPSAAGNVKAFFMALLGMKSDDKSLGATIDACANEGLAEGMKVRARTYRSPIKSRPGEEFLGTNWYHVPTSPTNPAR